MNASDIAAWWGAVVATLVLGWDVFKWRKTGVHIHVSASPNMRTFGNVPNSDPDRPYVLVEVVNVGDRKIEITHLTGQYYTSRLQRLRRKNQQSFVVIKPALATNFPCFLEPGERWLGGISQTPELEAFSRNGLLYCGVIHSQSKMPATVRVIIDAKAT